jgi:probable F420-dependent oxidoreductase
MIKIFYTISQETREDFHVLKIGLSTFAVPAHELTELAMAAEAAGFESVWMSDHLVIPEGFEAKYPYSADGAAPFTSDIELLDPWISLAAMAAVTKSVRLGTWIYVLPARHHLVTARAVATVDLVSNGRAILGVGAGWLREEIEAAGFEWEGRGGRVDEIIEALRLLWTQEVSELRGTHIDLPPVYFEPKPVQGGALPIFVGGETPAARRRAARLGNGWMGMQADPATAADSVRDVRALRDASGATGPFEITVGAVGMMDPELYEAYAATGADRMIVSPWFYAGSDWRATIDAVERTLASVR